jgi:hypothetical protein
LNIEHSVTTPSVRERVAFVGIATAIAFLLFWRHPATGLLAGLLALVCGIFAGLPALYASLGRGWTRLDQLVLTGLGAGGVSAILLSILTAVLFYWVSPRPVHTWPWTLVPTPLLYLPAVVGALTGAMYWVSFLSGTARRGLAPAVAAVVAAASIGPGLLTTSIMPEITIRAPRLMPRPNPHQASASFSWELDGSDDDRVATLTRVDRPSCVVVIHSNDFVRRLVTDANPVMVVFQLPEDRESTEKTQVARIGWIVEPRDLSRAKISGCTPWD